MIEELGGKPTRLLKLASIWRGSRFQVLGSFGRVPFEGLACLDIGFRIYGFGFWNVKFAVPSVA